MAPILYTACVLGAVALYVLLRPGTRVLKVPAVILGLGALAWAFRGVVNALDGDGAGGPPLFFMVFATIAVMAAVRMITHHRPVFSALYFVMVVLSSSGLFLLLEAEFMAFALIIVYAGAIMITYVFVIMLAQQASDSQELDEQAEYDRNPREPAAAALVGFVLLAILGEMIVSPQRMDSLPSAPTEMAARDDAWTRLAFMPLRIEEAVRKQVPDVEAVLLDTFSVADGEATVQIRLPEFANPQSLLLDPSALPENIQDVGLALVGSFPASLELAGVILLMAMFGAVVLAQRQIEFSEAEKRAAASGGGSRR